MKRIYRFLGSYGLGRQDKVERRLRRFSEAKLARFVDSYLEMAGRRALAIRASTGAVDIYPDSWAEPMPTTLIKQLGVYANKIYVHDPLVKIAVEWQYIDILVPYVMKYKTRAERVSHCRAKLASSIRKILDLQSFVESGVVHLIPTELILPRREPGALYADDLYGTKGTLVQESKYLPPRFNEYCDRFLEAYPADYVGDEPAIVGTQISSPCRMIAVQFANDPIPKFYHLFSITVPEGSDAQDGKFGMHLDITGQEPVHPSTFQHWLEGSRQKTAVERVECLQHDLLLAAMARARFLTNLPVSTDLAQLDINPETKTGSLDVVTALLKLDLPYFENASLADIVKARQNEAAFEEFRIVLDKAFKEIEALPDSPEFQKAVDEISRDLLLHPLARIEQKMKSLQRSLLIDAVIAAGSLISTIITQGNTLIGAAAILAASKALEMYKEDKTQEEEVKELPSFFYWQVTRKARRGIPH